MNVVFLYTHIYLVTPVPTRDSPGSGDSGLQVGLTWTGEWGCHLRLTIPGDSVPHVGLLDLVNLVLTWSSPRPGDSGHQLASSGPGESGPRLGLTQSW